MGTILGFVIIGALYLTIFLVCKYKNMDSFMDALDEIEKELENKDNQTN